MSYWLYIQTTINLALAGACVYLFVQQRRARLAGNWQRQLAPLVETLGELLVEIDRVSAAAVPTAGRISSEAVVSPEPQPLAPAPVAEPIAVAPAPVATAAVSKPVPAAQPSPVTPVLKLAEQGLDAEQIAKQLGRPIGEVTLVLGLRSSFAATA